MCSPVTSWTEDLGCYLPGVRSQVFFPSPRTTSHIFIYVYTRIHIYVNRVTGYCSIIESWNNEFPNDGDFFFFRFGFFHMKIFKSIDLNWEYDYIVRTCIYTCIDRTIFNHQLLSKIDWCCPCAPTGHERNLHTERKGKVLAKLLYMHTVVEKKFNDLELRLIFEYLRKGGKKRNDTHMRMRKPIFLFRNSKWDVD